MSEVITSNTELVYRLRDWGTDWMAEPFTGEKTVPDFSVQLAAGMSSARKDLPYPVRVIWEAARTHD